MIVAPSSVNQSIYFKLVHPTTFVPVTGATITDLDATYIRDLAAAVKNDLTALALVTTAHTDNKGIEIDATNAPGVYRVDFPDAAFEAGAARVQLVINGAAIAPAIKEVELAAWLTPITGVSITSVSGNVNGNVGGNVNGNVNGDVVGSVGGNVNGNVIGNVIGNVEGSVANVLAIGGVDMRSGPIPSVAPGTEGGLTTTDASGNMVQTVLLTATERDNLVDAMLKRDWTGLTGEASRSMLNALRFIRNKWSIGGTTLTVTKENDTDAAWTAALSTDADAEPVIGVDPA